MSVTTAALLADAMLALHLGVVLFVVGGLPYVLLGYRRGWRGARLLVFRLGHLLAVGIGAAQGFVAHWLGRLLYWDAPGWVFTAAYTLFGLAVLAAWWWLPPERRRG